MDTHSLKCVVIGDPTVGKTCLLMRYARNDFPTDYVPTIFENYGVTVPVGGQDYTLHLYDTAGQEDYNQLRTYAYNNTDIFLVCFAIDLLSSFMNVREKWIPELERYSPQTPFILVGMKTDLRNNPGVIESLAIKGQSPISNNRGKQLAKQLNAAEYVECSAFTRANVDEVFNSAILIAIQNESICSPRPPHVAKPLVVPKKNHCFLRCCKACDCNCALMYAAVLGYYLC